MDYMPKSDTETVTLLSNIAVKLPTHSTALGLTAADVTNVQSDALMLAYLVNTLVPIFRSELAERVAYKTLVKDGPIGEVGGAFPDLPTVPPAPALVAPGIVPRLRALVQRVKAAPGYTEAIGADLGIVTTGASGEKATKPGLTATAQPKSRVELTFTKNGYDGVEIEARRGQTAGAWEILGRDNYSPYLDSRPPLTENAPETREYRARFLKRDETTGEYSDIVSVSTTA